MLYFIGLLALSLLITALIVFAFLFLASGFAYWLATSSSTKAARIRALLKQSLEETNQDTATNASNDGSQQGRQKHKCLICRLHPIQSIQKLNPLLKPRERGIDNFAWARENLRTNQKKDYRTEYPKTSPKGFIPRRIIPRWLTFSQRHIRTIVNWIRGRVNESGKEPTLLTGLFQMSSSLTSVWGVEKFFYVFSNPPQVLADISLDLARP